MNLVPILIGGDSDREHLKEGLVFLKEHGVDHEVIVASVHRNPYESVDRIRSLVGGGKIAGLRVIIAGAHAASGLPGVLAGCLQGTCIVPIGFRCIAEEDRGHPIIEDQSFHLSALPRGVPLLYAGYNSQGFYHACMLAARILGKTV